MAEDEDFTYISLFAGIEAASVAWEHMGWKPVCFADIDDFPSAVLAHHYPDVPNVGDVTEVDWSEYEGKANLVVGGSPCQSFSVAGRRLGLDDPRGNLAIEFCRVVERVKPTWFVFENVAGILSSDGGRDFATLLQLMGECGYGVAYRILDAKHFGVPQRRRRVFVVGHSSGDWRRPASVLFEPESLHRHFEASKAERKTDTGSVGESIGEGGESIVGRGMNWDGSNEHETLTASHHRQRMPDKNSFAAVIQEDDGIPEHADTVTAKWAKGADIPLQFGQKEKGTGNIIPVADPNPKEAGCITTNIYHNMGFDNQTVNTPGHLIVEDENKPFPIQGDGSFDNAKQNGAGISDSEHHYTLTTRDHHSVAQPVGFDWKNIGQTQFGKDESGAPLTVEGGLAVAIEPTHSFDPAFGQNGRFFENVSPTLKVNGLVPISPAVTQRPMSRDLVVRRLTPIECERLQGFPDNYTRIPWKGKAAEDCPDSPRYKAIGNSMAVPVMRWIGEGIELVRHIPSSPLPTEEDGISSLRGGVAMRQQTMDSFFE